MQRFAFRFTAAYRVAGLPFGVTPGTAHAELAPDAVTVRFGPWHVETRPQNVSEVEITGPYWFVKTGGPARLALSDRGLTFATNHHHGVRLSFRSPIRGIEPLGLLLHPELTITVAEPERYVSVLEELIEAGDAAGVAGW